MLTTIKYIERTDIKLKTQADCYKALLDGYILKHNDDLIKLVDGYLYDIKAGCEDIWSFTEPTDWTVYEEVQTPWYETATFPILCWATKEKNYPVMILSYEMSEPSEYGTIIPIFKSEITTWTDVSPITKEEFEQYNGQLNSPK